MLLVQQYPQGHTGRLPVPQKVHDLLAMLVTCHVFQVVSTQAAVGQEFY